MKQNISGGISNVNEDTGVASFVSQTRNKLINVCKSCGETDYLWKTEAEYKNHLRREQEKAIAKKKAEERAAEADKQHRIKNPEGHAFGASFVWFIGCALVFFTALMILNAVSTLFNDRGTALMSVTGLIFLTVILSTIVAMIVGFGQLEENKKLIKEERRKRLNSGNSPRW